MALHRDIYWVGRQWAVTGFGVQAVDQRLHGAFDIEASLVWEDDLPERMRTHAWVNSEDFDTIERFKSALAEIPGYRFDYVDNHASLISDLRGQRPRFILNLCDEGYNNDAFMELHVPALLEMLDIPRRTLNEKMTRYAIERKDYYRP